MLEPPKDPTQAEAWARIPKDLHRRASALSRQMMRLPADDDAEAQPQEALRAVPLTDHGAGPYRRHDDDKA